MSRILTLFLILFSLNGFAQYKPNKPKLIVHIIVEQMNYNYIQNYEDNFGHSGLIEIFENGLNCMNAHLNYAYAESAPSFATISTGATPSSHGIISNVWYDRLRNIKKHAFQDDSAECVGCEKPEYYKKSPQNMVAATFADQLVRNSSGQSKAFSVSLEPYSSISMGGRLSQGVYWVDDYSGKWVTSSFYKPLLPDWVHQFNNNNFADDYLKKTWDTYLSMSKYRASLPDFTTFEMGIGLNKQITFPYRLRDIKDPFIPYKVIKQTPYGNTYVKDFAIELIQKEQLGLDDYTDYLAISFTATEEIGNKFGSTSKEVEDCFLRLDNDISLFLSHLNKIIGKDNYLIVFQSSHGVDEPVKFLQEQNVPAGVFKSVEGMYILDKFLDATYGDADWIQHYQDQQVYLNRRAIIEKNLIVSDIQSVAAEFIAQLAGVQNVLTATAMTSSSFTTEEKKKVDNSFYLDRSGDLFILLKPGWAPLSMNVVGHHTSPYASVCHIPLVWYGWKMDTEYIDDPISVTDIVPTLCLIAGIPRPNMSLGGIIREVMKQTRK